MKSENPGMTAAQLLAILNARKFADRFNFYDEFTRKAVDTDIWTQAGDGGAWTLMDAYDVSTWRLTTGVVIDNDEYLHGLTTKYAKTFAIQDEGVTSITFKARIRMNLITDISAMLGLFRQPPTGYSEPASDCAQFLFDPAITNTFRARTYRAAEEETDTLVTPLVTDFYELKFVLTATNVLFYIDDALVATHATQVPDYPMNLAFLVRTEAAAARHLILDYVRIEVN